MNSISVSKRVNAFFILLFLLFFTAMPLFAQDAITRMNSVALKILEFFKSPLIKTILVIALCGSAIAFAINKDNQRLKSGAIAIGVAVLILLAAEPIVTLLLESA
jgi:hypothetical protein